MTPVTLAIDAMGGDFGPPVTVPAAVQALTSDLCLEIFLVGPPTLLEPLLATADSRVRQRIHLCPSEFVIASDATPSQTIRHARGSSMYIALELMVNGKVDACLSGGNTGVLMGLAMLLLKPLPGIRRPALMTLLPYQHKKQTVVLDLGANLSADQEMLVQFALMGSVVAREILGIAKPRVALLNVGQESSKGPEAIRQAAKRLQQLPDIRYIGYLEGNDLLTGKTDVLVSDGFSGNIALKTMEGVVRLFFSLLQGSPHRPKAWWRRWVTQLIKQKLAVEFGPVNPDQYNGAFLLGLPGMVMKSHGAANQQAFLAAIEQTVITVQRQLPKRIVSQLATVLSRSDNA